MRPVLRFLKTWWCSTSWHSQPHCWKKMPSHAAAKTRTAKCAHVSPVYVAMAAHDETAMRSVVAILYA